MLRRAPIMHLRKLGLILPTGNFKWHNNNDVVST